MLSVSRRSLVFQLPLVIWHTIHTLSGLVIIHFQSRVLGCCHVPLGQTVTTETREVHQVDILCILAAVQMGLADDETPPPQFCLNRSISLSLPLDNAAD